MFWHIIIVIKLCMLGIMCYLNYNKLKEHYTADEAIKNVASLYNQGNLTTTQLTTQNVIGPNNNLKLSGNVTMTGSAVVTGGIASPTINDLNNKINQINGKLTDLGNQINTKNPIMKCNWNGWNVVCGSCSDEHDDYAIYCDGGKVTAFNVGKGSKWSYHGIDFPGSRAPW